MEKSFTKIFWQAIIVGLLTGLIVVRFSFGIENLFSFIMAKFYSTPLLFYQGIVTFAQMQESN